MNRRRFFLAILFGDLLLGIVLVWLARELTISSTTTPLLSTVQPTLEAARAATITPFFTQTRPLSPTGTRTPIRILHPTLPPRTRTFTPTPLDIDPQILALLDLKPDAYCVKPFEQSPSCFETAVVAILEYLDSHPNSPARAKLQDKAFDLAHRLANDPTRALNWIVDDWVHKILPERIRATSDPTTNVPYLWRDRMNVVKTDMDQDGRADYFVALQYTEGAAYRVAGALYWIRFESNHSNVQNLQNDISSKESRVPRILAVRDLDLDGRMEIVYVTTDCGASNCFEQIRVRAFEDGAFRDMPRVSFRAAQNGGWQIRDLPDGKAELIMDVRDGASLGSRGPYPPYELHFRSLRNEYVPLLTSTQYELVGFSALQYSEQLMLEGRYADAIAYLEKVSIQKLEYSGETFDYRPYALYRMGMLYLYLDDVQNAQRAWQELITHYPDLTISHDVSKFRTLAQTGDDAWRICKWLDQNAQNWTPAQDLSIYGRTYPLYFGWGKMCDATQFLRATQWTSTQTIETQMQVRGMNWQTVSNEYDLNGDGVKDPLGIFSFQKLNVPWAMLS